MRKFIITALAVLMLASSVFAAPAVSVVINGTPVSFTESSGAPFIDSNNRTLVPMRVVMEQYGCTVNWSQSTKTASVAAGDTTVLVPIGQSYIMVNGEQKAIDAPAQIVSGRTYLPIRAVLEAFGANVGWDNANRSVTVAGGANAVESTNSSSNTNTNNSQNSNEQMSYDEFIGLFDEITREDDPLLEGMYTVGFIASSLTKNDLDAVLKNDYAPEYIYEYLSKNDSFESIYTIIITIKTYYESSCRVEGYYLDRGFGTFKDAFAKSVNMLSSESSR